MLYPVKYLFNPGNILTIIVGPDMTETSMMIVTILPFLSDFEFWPQLPGMLQEPFSHMVVFSCSFVKR